MGASHARGHGAVVNLSSTTGMTGRPPHDLQESTQPLVIMRWP
ncbi:hypothetical protein ACH4TX_12925 [Streptomyces sp. NPDC021098]